MRGEVYLPLGHLETWRNIPAKVK